MIPLSSFLLGTIVGSFLNVLVLRHGAKSISGRSECFSCGTRIFWYDNIPVLSYLALYGRCRRCGSAISIQYPIIELLTGVLFGAVGAALVPPLLPIGAIDAALIALYVIFSGGFIAIALYDARHTIIPDAWVYACALVALVIALFTHASPLYMTILSGPFAALPLFALWIASSGRWMGLGDVKLALAIGWFLGPYFGAISIFFAFIIGALVSVGILLPMPRVMRYARERGIVRWRGTGAGFTMKSEVAFGPFLIASFFIVWIAQLYQVPLPL